MSPGGRGFEQFSDSGDVTAAYERLRNSLLKLVPRVRMPGRRRED